MHQLVPTDHDLMDGWQRGLPLVPRPFAAIGDATGLSEAEVLARLGALVASGAVARVGGTVRPNTAGASTLAAVMAPEDRIEEVAAVIGAEPGVNHSYLREHDWNLWFVVTAADRGAIDAALGRIERRTGLRVLDLPLVRPYTLDLGFRLAGPRAAPGLRESPDTAALRPGDGAILQAMTRGLALVPRPFRELGRALGHSEADVIARVAALQAAGILQRIGVIVRHRALGWTSNAMVVWELPDARIDAAGRALAAHPGVTLCYRRRTVPGVWPFALFSMIHGRSRAETLAVLDTAAALPELAGARHRALFSVRCFKQTGATLAREGAAGAGAR
jgi:DNA-binding Lrp family transcriptional regulator